MPDPTALTRLRKVAGVIFAISVAVGLVVLWIPNQKLQDQSPIQTLIAPRSFTDREYVPEDPRWQPAFFFCTNRFGVPETRSSNPKVGDCYQDPSTGEVFEFGLKVTFSEQKKTLSRFTALGVIGRAMARALVLQIIVLACIALTYSTYRLVVGKQQRK